MTTSYSAIKNAAQKLLGRSLDMYLYAVFDVDGLEPLTSRREDLDPLHRDGAVGEVHVLQLRAALTVRV